VAGDKNSAPVPRWLWRMIAGMLGLTIATGPMVALWLGTRPTVAGIPIPSDHSGQVLGAWTLGSGASGSETNGQFTLRADLGQANRVVYAAGELMLDDFTVQVRTKLLAGPDDAGYGLVVRQHGSDEFTALLIGADGYIAAGQMSGGVWRWRVAWQQWPHIRRGTAENVLRAQCRVERCKFFVNDEFAFEIDGLPAQGRIGPALWSPTAESSPAATFREWRIWK